MLKTKNNLSSLIDSTENSEPLSVIVASFLSTYYEKHQDHLPQGQVYALVMNEVEKSLLAATLNFVSSNQTKASSILGINRNTLRKKMLEYNLLPTD